MGLRPRDFCAKLGGLSQFGSVLEVFAPNPRTQTQTVPNAPKRTLRETPLGVRGFCRLGLEKRSGFKVLRPKPEVLARRVAEGPAEEGVGGGKPPPKQVLNTPTDGRRIYHSRNTLFF